MSCSPFGSHVIEKVMQTIDKSLEDLEEEKLDEFYQVWEYGSMDEQISTIIWNGMLTKVWQVSLYNTHPSFFPYSFYAAFRRQYAVSSWLTLLTDMLPTWHDVFWF